MFKPIRTVGGKTQRARKRCVLLKHPAELSRCLRIYPLSLIKYMMENQRCSSNWFLLAQNHFLSGDFSRKTGRFAQGKPHRCQEEPQLIEADDDGLGRPRWSDEVRKFLEKLQNPPKKKTLHGFLEEGVVC